MGRGGTGKGSPPPPPTTHSVADEKAKVAERASKFREMQKQSADEERARKEALDSIDRYVRPDFHGTGPNKRVRLVTSDISRRACPGDPETNARYTEIIVHVEQVLACRPDIDELSWQRNATRVAPDEVLLQGGVHTMNYLDALKQRTASAPGFDVSCSAGWTMDTELAARVAVASLIDCAQVVLDGSYTSGFVLAKPPSHHNVGNANLAKNPVSRLNLPFGFSHLNSIAAAVANTRARRPEIAKVCILDFDVHCGNGNEDTFWEDPSVFTISVHQRGIWPTESGLSDSVGGLDGKGSVLNLPIPEDATDSDYVHAFNGYVFPAVDRFDPDVLFIAAGFDAMKEDKYGQQRLTAYWYGWCISELLRRDIAPMILNLEGGYDTRAVGRAVDATIDALTGVPPEHFLRYMQVEAHDRHAQYYQDLFHSRAMHL